MGALDCLGGGVLWGDGALEEAPFSLSVQSCRAEKFLRNI